MRPDLYILWFAAASVPVSGRTISSEELGSDLSANAAHPRSDRFGLEKRQFRQQRVRVNWIVTLAQATDLILNVFVQTDSNGRVSIVPEQVNLGWILSNPQATGGSNEYASMLSIVRPWGRATAQIFWNAVTGSWMGVVSDGVVNDRGQEIQHSLNWCS
ncbi:uncharacterized protein FMAN_06283 [Fusarium mangiferae]|uniref:Uncharacterized protein n=1 Tax=Fusarium mangiferae TaxID=192010 RepID=A0A1L7SJA4_FUSMA|nr:uncharacterized protein FMAN_06283 [Fusarium mangiferae]CVK86445.1 uncharacterized protein FMAN_06283 [Fusarium mangiferae]